MTYFLIGLCVLITVANLTSTDMPGTPWYRLGHFSVLTPEDIWNGYYYGLITSVFVHISPLHLLFNMYWLWKMGSVLELTLNPWVYILFFITAAIVSAGTQIAISTIPGTGESGVGYAMLGLLWAGRGTYPEWRAIATRENLQLFLVWGIFCILTTVFHYMEVANAAHAGGLVFGLAVGWLFFAPRRRTLWIAPLALVVLLTVFSVSWMPWSTEWDFWKGNREFNRHHYRNAIDWYSRSIKWGGESDPAWNNIGLSWYRIAKEDWDRQDLAGAQQALKEAESAQKKISPAALDRVVTPSHETDGAPPRPDAPTGNSK